MNKNIVPGNEKGKQVDLFEEVTFSSTQKAMEVYQHARHKLLHPVIWKPMTGPAAAAFKEADAGKNYGRPVTEGDFIKIDIPGPGLSAGDGHDWVRVKSIIENADPDAEKSIALTVEVCENPEHPEKGIAHFFAEGASSTFTIHLKETIVKAGYHGRNETPNLGNPDLGDKIRNTIVAIGAMAGMSELQWKAFLKGLLA